MRVDIAAYRIPTAAPESDGTLEWDSTTLVAVHISADDKTGFGYTYADTATATLIRDVLAPLVGDPYDIDKTWAAMIRAVAQKDGYITGGYQVMLRGKGGPTLTP